MLKYRILCIILMIAGLIGLSLSLFAYENLPLQYISSAMILVGLFGNAGIAIHAAEETSHRKGSITMKKVQIVFLIALLILLVVTIDLGRNYFLALDPAINDGITCRSIFHISGVFEPFGDHWTLDSFRLAFVRSLRLTLLVFWGNIALLCCDWWEKKHGK